MHPVYFRIVGFGEDPLHPVWITGDRRRSDAARPLHYSWIVEPTPNALIPYYSVSTGRSEPRNSLRLELPPNLLVYYLELREVLQVHGRFVNSLSILIDAVVLYCLITHYEERIDQYANRVMGRKAGN